MNLSATRTGINNSFRSIKRANVRPNAVYSLIIILALIAFEAFNYGTTAYALRDLLGDLRFAGMQWATLLALAFCGLDFAGFARLITQKGRTEDRSGSWYLFCAWLIAAGVNAALTWWGVSIAISSHSLTSSMVASTQSITAIVPVIVAVMVWIIRVLIIGSLTSALEQNHQSRNAAVRERTSTVPAGFPVNTQSAPSHARPQSASQPVRSVAAQQNRGPAYRNYMAAHTQQNSPNEFMAAENRSRNL